MQEQSGDVHVSTQDVWLTEHAVKILGQLLIVPEAAQTAFRLGLSALLNRLAQCSEFAVSAPTKLAAYGPGGLLSCIYSLHRRPGGDEQLVRELQLQSISNILTQTLDWVDCGYFTELSVESNNFNEGMLASAGALVCLKCFVCACMLSPCHCKSNFTSCLLLFCLYLCAWPCCISSTSQVW